MTEVEYIRTRIDDQIMWYSTKATQNKRYNHWSKAAIIVFSASIPLIAGIEFSPSFKNILIGVLGALIAIVSGLSGLLKFQEKWTEYRTTSETLKHEKILFQTKTGPYSEEGEPFKMLVTRTENLVSKEHSAWSQYINKQN
ncbi:MAG: DUF4231 domain-containing protein [Bacteroidetes bacterium]|nr:MAG: DUF4231 domain-containing protein [Bacteroidota bacterium]